jgi:predicted Zn-dependent peptidase
MSETLLDRTRAPRSSNNFVFSTDPPNYLLRINDSEIYALHNENTELIKLDFVFQKGEAHQPQNLYNSTAITMAEKGTVTKSSKEIADFIDFYGAYIQPFSSTDSSGLSLITLQKYFNDVFPLFCDIILNPVFDVNELEIYLKSRLNTFLINNEKTSFIASQHFTHLLYGAKHPLGKLIAADDYSSEKYNDLSEYYKNNLLKAPKLVYLTGKTNETMKKQVEDFCNNPIFNSKQFTYNEFESSQPNPKRHHIIKPDSIQSSIRIGKTLEIGDNPKVNAEFRLLNTLLGGYFGSRLMSNLREKNGFTYGVNSTVFASNLGKYMVIGTDVGSENTQNAVNEIMNEINFLTESPCSDEEFERVKNYSIGSFLRSFDGPFSITEKYRNLKIRNLPFNYYADYFQALTHANKSKIIDLAKEHLQADSFTVLTVGK